MPTAIFVHGTGVREPAFTRLFALIERQLTEKRPDLTVVPCYWGGTQGAQLWHDGGSIPSYDTARAIAPAPQPAREDESVALWSLLYRDPLWELRTLAALSRTSGEMPPGRIPPGDELDTRVQSLQVSAELADALAAAALAEAFEPARATVTADFSYRQALIGAADGLGALRLAIARAIVAQALIEQDERDGGDSIVAPDADARDHVVTVLVDDLGGVDMGIPELVAAPVRGLALRLVTSRLQRRRGAITDAAYPAAGDVLLYQARGHRIRSFIADRIRTAAEPVVLITHSLGGIAAVDLLASQAFPSVQLLVTVGSQAPFLYEIGALWSLAHDEALPAHVPTWLNLYDRRDILSYVGGPLFPGRVQDVAVNNGQPFPQSHSAYWTNRKVWDEIAARIP